MASRSDEAPLSLGFRQGSVLGPVLFVLYTQPLFKLIKKHSIQHHSFANDNHLYKETVPDQTQTTTEIMQNCITDVKLWMTHNKLQLNDSEMESMLVKSHRLSVHFPLPSSMRIGNSEVLFVCSVKNLGVTLDCNLNMTQHVLNICRSAYIELRPIGSIRHLLSAQATQTLVCSFILSRLDYCNCLFAGCPQFLIDKFRTQQHNLSVGQKKIDHVQPILQSLHWLPIRARIQYKISQALDYNTSPNFSTCTLPLEISVPPQTHAFSRFLVLIQSIWSEIILTNRSLYLERCHSDSQTSFRQALKTHLSKQRF